VDALRKTDKPIIPIIDADPGPSVPIEPLPPLPTPPVSKLRQFASAIETYENAPKDWKNPGALTFTALTQELGAVDKTAGGFCVFETYEKGFKALCDFIELAAGDKLLRYHDCDILGFFKTYAPYPINNPEKYAQFAALKVSQKIGDKLKDFI
jgi:hypothetical protein